MMIIANVLSGNPYLVNVFELKEIGSRAKVLLKRFMAMKKQYHAFNLMILELWQVLRPAP